MKTEKGRNCCWSKLIKYQHGGVAVEGENVSKASTCGKLSLEKIAKTNRKLLSRNAIQVHIHALVM